MGIKKNRMVQLSIVVFVSVFLLTPIFLLKAQGTSVVINEIAWAGTTDDWQYEWIELYNNSEKEMDLAYWKIENILSKNGILEIVEGVVPSKGYALICRKEMHGCDLIETKLSLHNEYDKNGELILRNNTDDIIDSTPTPETKLWPGGDNETKQTMEWTGTSWQTSAEPNGTPKAQNSINLPPSIDLKIEPEPNIDISTSSHSTSSGQANIDMSPPEPEPTPIAVEIKYAKNIFINEILPSPKGADAENEWIELYNDNNFEVNLVDWQVQDTIGAVRTYTFPTDITINPLDFLILARPETKITLQNSGDGLKLLNPNQKIVHSIDYPKASQGQSYNRTGETWEWSDILTPAKQNIIPQPEIAQPEDGPRATQSPTTSNQREGGPPAVISDTLSASVEKTIPETSNHILTIIFAVIIAVGSGVVVLLIKTKKFDF